MPRLRYAPQGTHWRAAGNSVNRPGLLHRPTSPNTTPPPACFVHLHPTQLHPTLVTSTQPNLHPTLVTSTQPQLQPTSVTSTQPHSTLL